MSIKNFSYILETKMGPPEGAQKKKTNLHGGKYVR